MSKCVEHSAKSLDEIIESMKSQLNCEDPSFAELIDEVLKKKASKLKFQDYAYRREELKRILTRFFMFYLTGMIKPGDNVVATICDTIALARDPKELIFEAGHSEQKVFYSANSSDPSTRELTDLGAMLTTHLPGNFKDKAAIDTHQCTTSNIFPTDRQQFAEYIKTVIKKIHSINALDEERALCQFVAFLALTLCRATVKKKDPLSNAFVKFQYRKNLNSFAMWSSSKPYFPPSTRCLDLTITYLKKGQKIVSDLFSLLANAYCVRSPNVDADEFPMRFLLASVLTHTTYDGIGLLQLLMQVCHLIRLSWVEVMENTFHDTTKEAWISITRFFLTQKSKANPQRGFYWARIINPGYFQGLAIKDNPFLATIFASVIAEVKGDGIWKAEWVTRYGEGLDEARVIGRLLFKLATKPKAPVPLTKEAAEVLRTMEELEY